MDARLCRALHSEVAIGIGDEILAAGEARRAQAIDPRRVQIIDHHGAPRWHPIWEDNPRIATPGERGNFQQIRNGGNCRPYIVGKTATRWTWRAYQPTPGEIYLTPAERAFGEKHWPQVVIEPTVKPGASPNKQWGRWPTFAQLAIDAGYRLSQLGPRGTKALPGVDFIETPDFRHACAVLAHAEAYIGPDGALMHAAAALDIPTIVIRGAFISHECTGYESQVNLFTGTGLGCGMRVPCECCTKAMAAITPAMVMSELEAIR